MSVLGIFRWEVSPMSDEAKRRAREAVGSSSYIIMYLLVFVLILI